MLAGVDEDGLDFGVAAHLAEEWSDFYEIGASAYDVKNAHGWPDSWRTSRVTRAQGEYRLRRGELYSMRKLARGSTRAERIQ